MAEVKIIPGAEAYRLEGSNGYGVLLIHGYTGTPAELRPLGDHLNALGYTVLGVRLPGHGTSVQDLETTTADDWFAEAAKGMELLKAEFGEKVFVAGLSMGGLLTIRVAAKYQPKAAAIMSAPIFLPDKRVPFFWLFKYFIKELPKSKKNYHEMMKYNLSYSTMPTKPLGSLLAMMKNCKNNVLGQIKCPAIVLQSTVEHTVVPKSAQYIYDHLGSEPDAKKLIWLHQSGHIISLDMEREQAFAEIAEFFKQYV